MSDEDKKVTEPTVVGDNNEEGATPESAPVEPVEPVEPAKPVESKSAAKRKAVQKAAAKDEADAPASTDGEATETAKPEGMVVIRSADGRSLEASIGVNVWKGKEISVPVEQAGDVRRLLEDGGFFLKD